MGQLEQREEDGVTIYENPDSEELGATQVSEDAQAKTADLQKKTKAELLEMAKAEGVEADESMNKDRIVTLLNERLTSTSQ